MKSMLCSFSAIYYDVCSQSRAIPDNKDVLLVERRVKDEGMSFLTLTLPLLNDALLQGLERGYFDLNDCSAFGRFGRSALPKFLRGLLSKIFDSRTGKVLDTACATSIFGVRQLTCLFKKVQLPCSEERVAASVSKFLKTDSEVLPLRKVTKRDRTNLRTVMAILFGGCFSRVSDAIVAGELPCRHGTGAVAERLSANGKYDCAFYGRLEPLFPLSHYYSPSMGGGSCVDNRGYNDVGLEQPARLAQVPKTLKAPRLIAIEPTIVQFAQQGLMNAIYEALDSCPGGRILNIKDQTVNGERARIGSIDGAYCTLDLSEASDRVPAGLVSFLTRPWKPMQEALFRARSSKLDVEGDIIRLRKFASMGSAVCFPIEAILFAAIAVYSMILADNRSITKGTILSYVPKVTVFGDDIVADNRYALPIKLGLEYFGLKVNEGKSFSQGYFRESCGVDAFRGDDVTPVYMRRLIPSSLTSVEDVVSSVEFCNQLWAKGLWKAAESIQCLLEARLGTKFPVTACSSPVLSYCSPWSTYPERGRWNKDLHRYEVKGWLLKGAVQRTPMSDVGTMVKALLSLESRPSYEDTEVRKRALIEAQSRCNLIDEEPRSHALRLKRGWAPLA